MLFLRCQRSWQQYQTRSGAPGPQCSAGCPSFHCGSLSSLPTAAALLLCFAFVSFFTPPHQHEHCRYHWLTLLTSEVNFHVSFFITINNFPLTSIYWARLWQFGKWWFVLHSVSRWHHEGRLRPKPISPSMSHYWLWTCHCVAFAAIWASVWLVLSNLCLDMVDLLIFICQYSISVSCEDWHPLPPIMGMSFHGTQTTPPLVGLMVGGLVWNSRPQRLREAQNAHFR